MKINKLLGILLIVTIGCSTSMVGKQMPPANYIKVSPHLQHFDLKLIGIELQTEIDKQANTATAKGVITIQTDEMPPGAFAFDRINMKMLLMDKNYTVIKEVGFTTPSGIRSFWPIPFEVKFPYDPAYHYMSLNYMVYYWH